jgi:hypothetical protein
MKSVRRSFSVSVLSLAACVLLGLAGSRAAQAQAAPAPIGNWVNQNKSNGLVVETNGTCGFLVNGRAKWSGRCTWETPSAKGGILDLTYSMPLAPGHIRWSVIYVNATTITLDGEAFYKSGN